MSRKRSQRLCVPRAALVVACLAVCITSAAQSDKPWVTKRAYRGKAGRVGPMKSMQWEGWVKLPVDRVRERLSRWSRATELVEEGIEGKVLSPGGEGKPVRFRIKRKAPVFFMPDPEVVFEGAVDERKDGSVVVHWRLVEGMLKSGTRRWTLSAKHGGTHISYEERMELPVDPPSFVFDDEEAKEALEREVERFRKFVGAKSMSREPPAPLPAPK